MPVAIEMIRAAAPFDGWLRRAIHDLKYHGEWARGDDLGNLIAAAAADLPRCDVVMPTPLHPSRLRLRGFNQSRLLAEPVARSLGLPLREGLVRTRRTGAQVHLAAEARLENVAGAFVVVPGTSLDGATVLLIDDVVTTGATLGACADALVAAGAAQVVAATLAREM
jgi:ComF family protein